MVRRILPIPNARLQFERRPGNRIVEIFRRRKRNGRGNPDAGGVMVEPDKPRDLSGGAAAALEFDD